MLEQQNTANLGCDVNALLHTPRVECCGAALEQLLAVFVHSVVQVQVQCEVRPLCTFRRLISAIAMSFGGQYMFCERVGNYVYL